MPAEKSKDAFSSAGLPPVSGAGGRCARGEASPSGGLPARMAKGGNSAFTLVEMLVVTAIIGILLALVVPATVSMTRGIQIGQAGDLIHSQLDLARQTALARNRSVQVRFCRLPGGHFTEMMVLLVSTSASGTVSYTALARPTALPISTIIDSGPTLSTMLNQSVVSVSTAAATDPPMGANGTNYQYVAFLFKPDGSTSLVYQTPASGSSSSGSQSLWYLTVHFLTDGDALTAPPVNYFAVQVDAYNGHLFDFRP